MISGKRVFWATLLGLVTGLLCYLGSRSSGIELTGAIIAAIFLNRTFNGFVIGISCWRINYLLHGIIIGGLGSLQMAIYGNLWGFSITMVAGMVWGLLIELFTSKVLKVPMVVPVGSATE